MDPRAKWNGIMICGRADAAMLRCKRKRLLDSNSIICRMSLCYCPQQQQRFTEACIYKGTNETSALIYSLYGVMKMNSNHFVIVCAYNDQHASFIFIFPRFHSSIPLKINLFLINFLLLIISSPLLNGILDSIPFRSLPLPFRIS